MEKRRIGSLQVSVVGIGCNNFGGRLDADATRAVIDGALEAGITFFDTADGYGGTKSEEYLGKALGARRRDVAIATKFGLPVDDARPGGASPAYVRASVEGSLRRLGTDYIDLYQLHRPDPATPIAETLETLDALVKAGTVREIGCSNFSPEQIAEAERALGPGAARFQSVQNEYSLFARDPENGVLAECERRGLAFLPFFPLASGLLSGKYRLGHPLTGGRLATPRYGNRFLSDKRLEAVEELIAFSAERGYTILELAFSWLLDRPAVASVIAGATSADQARANAAAPRWRLTPEDRARIDEIARRAA